MVSIIRAIAFLVHMCVHLIRACIAAYALGVLFVAAAGIGAWFGGVNDPAEAMEIASVAPGAALIFGAGTAVVTVLLVVTALGLAWVAQLGTNPTDN